MAGGIVGLHDKGPVKPLKSASAAEVDTPLVRW